jgi:adenosylcobyric acid synthase
VLSPEKTLCRATGEGLGETFSGYEMHIGETAGPDCARPFARLEGGRDDGAISADGRVFGSYVHGLLASTALRARLLERIAATPAGADYGISVETALDQIAATLEDCLDVDALLALASANGPQ